MHAGECPCYMFRGSGYVKYHEVVRIIAKRIPGVFEVVPVNLHVCCSKVTKALRFVFMGESLTGCHRGGSDLLVSLAAKSRFKYNSSRLHGQTVARRRQDRRVYQDNVCRLRDQELVPLCTC